MSSALTTSTRMRAGRAYYLRRNVTCSVNAPDSIMSWTRQPTKGLYELPLHCKPRLPSAINSFSEVTIQPILRQPK